MAVFGAGCRIAPTKPNMTWVGASYLAFPSIFPLRTNAKASDADSPILTSRPSAFQMVVRRTRRIHFSMSLPLNPIKSARPAPMGLCRQAAVGPEDRSKSNAQATAPTGRTKRPDHLSRRRESKTTAPKRRLKRKIIIFQLPVAVNKGKSIKPPIRDPAIAPPVFDAYAWPVCHPTFSSPRPSKPMSSGN